MSPYAIQPRLPFSLSPPAPLWARLASPRSLCGPFPFDVPLSAADELQEAIDKSQKALAEAEAGAEERRKLVFWNAFIK